MRVKLTKDHTVGRKKHAAGEELDLPHDHASRLVKAGSAEKVERRRAAGATEDTMRIRFRHDHTIDGKGHLAGQVAVVPQSDEAWACVNEGHADLDPAPGVNGQPFPPEETQRDETTDVPAPPVVTATAADTARVTTHHAKGKDEK